MAEGASPEQSSEVGALAQRLNEKPLSGQAFMKACSDIGDSDNLQPPSPAEVTQVLRLIESHHSSLGDITLREARDSMMNGILNELISDQETNEALLKIARKLNAHIDDAIHQVVSTELPFGDEEVYDLITDTIDDDSFQDTLLDIAQRGNRAPIAAIEVLLEEKEFDAIQLKLICEKGMLATGKDEDALTWLKAY